MFNLAQDFRFALRLLRRSPVPAAAAILSLATGIGATTVVFSLADGLVLRPLPAVHAASELVVVRSIHKEQPGSPRPLSWANYLDYAASADSFSALAAFADCSVSLVRSGPAERLDAAAVTSNYFSVLGLKPASGRLIMAGDDARPIVVIGHGLWERRFGADPAVIGSEVSLNGKTVTVAGVAPEGFGGTDRITRREIWLPIGVYSEVVAGIPVPFSGKHDREQQWLNVIGRLKPGPTIVEAQAALSVIAARLAAEYPEVNSGRGVRVLPLNEQALGHEARPVLRGFSTRLMIVAALVLGAAVINSAGLLVARGLARRRETALRLSLGAGRPQLVRQLLIEGLVLGFLGGAGGIGLAWAGLPLVERLDLPIGLAVRDLQLSSRVLAFALFVTLTSCLVLALVPALQTARAALVPALRGEVSRRRWQGYGLREALVGTQVALALLIAIAAGLMFRTVANLRAIDPGFDPGQVLVVSVDLAPAGYKGPQVAAFFEGLLQRLRRLPGVADATMVSALPVMGAKLSVDLTVMLEDPPSLEGSSPPPSARHTLVGSGFFRTVGMPILKGRDFGPQDANSEVGAVILNETAARRFWPGRDPLGRRLRLVQSETPFEVVGVAGDAIYADLKEEPVPVLYLSHAQHEKSFIGTLLAPGMTLLVRSEGGPRGLLGAVRETVRAMDPVVPVYQVSTLEDLLSSTVGVERHAAALYGGLALVALALAMLGLYAVLVHAIVERTREIGVRVALGAKPEAVQSLVLRRSAFLILAGMAAGFAAAVPASRIVAGQLYGVDVYDPGTWLLTALLLACTSLLVSMVPARRATRIDPMAALRYE